MVPGRLYSPHGPLLAYAAKAAAARGAHVRHTHWRAPARLGPGGDATSDERMEWVAGQVAPALDEVTVPAGRPLLIGKSLGSCAAELAVERGLPAVWLTPLLRDRGVLTALGAATAPVLLIGGTADRLAWRGDRARSLTPHVVEVADADHDLCVPGPLAASATVLGLVATAVERFLDDVVWPDPPPSD